MYFLKQPVQREHMEKLARNDVIAKTLKAVTTLPDSVLAKMDGEETNAKERVFQVPVTLFP